MNRRTNLPGTPLLFILLAVASLLPSARLMFNSPAKADDTPKVSDADLTVSTEEIRKDFAADEAAAKTKYLNKVVRLTGTLKTVADFDADGNYAFTFEGAPAVNCVASHSGSKGCKSISVGQDATVQGKCTTATADSFALSACRLISLGKDPSINVSAAELAKPYAAKTDTSIYDEKTVTVVGTVAKVDVDTFKIFLEGATAPDGSPVRVRCVLGVAAADAIKTVTPGNKVTVKGTCNGMMDTADVVIQFAVLQEFP